MADAVGFRVRNQNKILQIDGNYQNQELVSVNTYTMSSKDNDILGYYAAVSVPGDRSNPTIAVSGSSQGVYVKKISQRVFRIYSGNNLDGTRTAKVYIFADPLNNSIGGIGLVVRNRMTGSVVYNSNKKYIRILGVTPVSLGINQTFSVAYPGRTIALVQSVRPYARKTDTGGPPNQPIGLFGFFSGVMRSPNASSYIIEHRSVASAVGGNVGNTLYTSPWGSYLVVDVTGY